MSKTFRSFLPVFAASLLILQAFNNSHAQDVEVFIKIDAKSPTKVSIRGKFLKPQVNRSLSFLSNLGNVSGIGERYSNVEVFDSKDLAINMRRVTAAEYLADRTFEKFSYQIDLKPFKQPFAAAHLSWLDDGGILMLYDLLPQFGKQTSARVELDIPARWVVAASEKVASHYTFSVREVGSAVFLIDTEDLKRRIISRGSGVDINISGEWPFSDTDAEEIAVSIFSEYKRLFRAVQTGNVVIGLRKFPYPIAPGNWEADTRGRTVTVISSDATFKSQSLQQLHEQLRHEMFHLWIPYGVNLTGTYDWFYEGFALYQALKLGVGVNRIRFDDYLDILSRAYDIDRLQAQKLSLIDVSKNRWLGTNNKRVYARGMLVAFLCDLALLEKSKGKRSVTDLLRQLYERHRQPAAEADGNTAVLALLRSHRELAPIIDRNVTGSESIEWNDLLKGAGLEAEQKDKTTKLRVIAKLSDGQKDLLDKLGYNNWRKLASK